MHAECLELETEVSYVRRLTQARIDILEAEIGRRERGESMEDLIRALPTILADTGPRAAPAASHLPLQMAPAQDSEWASELEEFDGLLANLPVLSDDGLVDAIDRLRSLERDVSAERRSLLQRDRPHRPPPRRAPQHPIARDTRLPGRSQTVRQ